ncbi:MAG: hypothetical protein EBX47_12140 [Synechococcaceae bacterium WB8_1B_057]|nr:hypothetical protein [Synechococcaceae bacterium WB6_1A_059]NDG80147.1 hypothetical protein [Synechococcaceae bacterium WB8_1B_057]
MYDWTYESKQVQHYYRKLDGKILGTVWQYINNNIVWVSKILDDEFPFTNQSEKFLGHYVSQDSAKKSVEKFWQIQDNTLTDDSQIKGIIDAS